MTEPSQYFKGRTVQEQMNEVIGYVDVRAEEVAAAKADDVLEPAEQAKTDAIAAKEAAEDARDATLAALPTIQQDIADLKAEDVSLDRRLDTVELKVQTAEGNIVTIQGQIVALQTADGQNVKINRINDYAVGLTGNQKVFGTKIYDQPIPCDIIGVPIQRSYGYYKTHNLGGLSGDGTWYLNVIFAWRYSIILAHIEVQFTSNTITNVTVSKLTGGEPVGNTKICFDIIDGDVYLVVHRVGQSNVYSRIVLCEVQKGASGHPTWVRLDDAELYTPSGELIEGDLV